MPDRLLDPQPATNRRTLVRTAAWTVPVVATAAAAPAFAASACATQTVAWSSVGARNFLTGGNTITTGSAATGDLVTVTVTASGTTTGTGNLVANAQQLGGQTSNLRLLLPATATAGVTQTVTLAFSPALSTVQFTLLDIDSDSVANGRYYDNVVPSAGFGYTLPPNGTVIGTGENTANGFRAPSSASPYDNAGTLGNVVLKYPATGTGSISSVRITYSSTTVADTDFRIGLSNLTVQRRAC